MASSKPRMFSPLVFAVALHAIILLLFLFSLQFSSENVSLPGTNVQIINAVAVNNNQINEQLAEVKAKIQAAKRAKEAANEKVLKQQQEQIKQRQVQEQKLKEAQKIIQKPAPVPEKNCPSRL